MVWICNASMLGATFIVWWYLHSLPLVLLFHNRLVQIPTLVCAGLIFGSSDSMKVGVESLTRENHVCTSSTRSACRFDWPRKPRFSLLVEDSIDFYVRLCGTEATNSFSPVKFGATRFSQFSASQNHSKDFLVDRCVVIFLWRTDEYHADPYPH